MGNTQNVILNYTTSGGYGHSACLKIHNQQWYFLDSENPGPINLDITPSEEGWKKVPGHTYILSEARPTDQQLDRFIPHGTDYTNPFQKGTVLDSPPPPTRGTTVQESPINLMSPPLQNQSRKKEGSPISSPQNLPPGASPVPSAAGI